MTFSNHCPQCGNEILESHTFAHSKVCADCGWSDSTIRQQNLKKQTKTTIVNLCIAAVIFVMAVFHLSNWGSESLNIIALKTLKATNLASISQLESIDSICKERDKHECRIDTYKQLHAQYPGKTEALYNMGHLLVQLKRHKEAVTPLKAFVAANKKELKARFDLAIALGKVGNMDEASKHFEYVLKKKPGTFQITVVENYVQLLIANNWLSRAKRVIFKYRKVGKNHLFLESEFLSIARQLKGLKSFAGAN